MTIYEVCVAACGFGWAWIAVATWARERRRSTEGRQALEMAKLAAAQPDKDDILPRLERAEAAVARLESRLQGFANREEMAKGRR